MKTKIGNVVVVESEMGVLSAVLAFPYHVGNKDEENDVVDKAEKGLLELVNKHLEGKKLKNHLEDYEIEDVLDNGYYNDDNGYDCSIRWSDNIVEFE